MTWARIDDGLYDDPRAARAGLDAMGLYVLAASYMGRYNTDGAITLERVKRLAGRRGTPLAAKLVEAGLWDATADGWRLVGWESVLMARAEVEKRSAGARAAGSKGGRARAERAAEGRPDEGGEESRREPGTYLGLSPGDNPADISGVQGANPAKEKRTGQPTPAHDPEPEPVPDSARTHARDIGDPPVRSPRPSGSAPLFVELCNPPASQPPKPRRRSRPEPPPEDPGTLDARARAAYDAIAADVSLRPICLGAVQLARDLCDVAPLVDVALEVKKAGAWMRADPSDPKRRKTRGNAFLSNWISRAQERAEREPKPPPAPVEEPTAPPLKMGWAKRPELPPLPEGRPPIDFAAWNENRLKERAAWEERQARRAAEVPRG